MGTITRRTYGALVLPPWSCAFTLMKVLLLTIQEDPPSLDTYNNGDDLGMWSESFQLMVRMCLQKAPSRQPTCQELLLHRHFRPLADAEGRAEYVCVCVCVSASGYEGGYCNVWDTNR
jgi:hypothetical protein